MEKKQNMRRQLTALALVDVDGRARGMTIDQTGKHTRALVCLLLFFCAVKKGSFLLPFLSLFYSILLCVLLRPV